MLISYSHRFIFIHIYKVAGTSIADALERYTAKGVDRRSPMLRFLRSLGVHRLVPRYRLRKVRAQRHATARAIRAELPPEIFDEFYKFAFVRNPWDWQVSLYHFALNDPSHAQHQFTKSFKSFEKYLEWRVDGHYRLQKDFVVDDQGQLIVDFVGRYETLARDFATICNRVGIDNPGLPHHRPSAHRDYRTYYTPRTAALVAEAFKEDIEFFGYELEQPGDFKPAAEFV
jgi:Sulfotransferase family